MKTKLLLAVLLLCLMPNLFAKNSKLYSSGDLTCNLITDIKQDSHGFVWIATEYGLNKFDGIHFVQYLHNDKDNTSLGGNFVRCLFQDSKNNLWIGLSCGIQRYLPENDSFKTISFDEGLTPFITAITEMSNGEIWITTSGRGVFVLNKKQNKLIRLNDISKRSSSFISSIFEDNKHQVWIGTDARGLFCFDLKTKKFKKKYDSPDFISSKITDIIQDKKGNLYISNSTNVKVLDKKTAQFYPILCSGNKTLSVSDMAIAKNGNIIIATDGQGMKYLDINFGSIHEFNHTFNIYDFSTAKISKVFEDRDLNIWLGCYFGGVLMLSNELTQFEFWNFKKQSNKITGAVKSICKDYQGFVWTCVDNEGVYKFDAKGKIITNFPQLKLAKVIFEDSQKSLWVGTSKGLGKMDKNTGLIKYIPALTNKPIKFLAEDKNLNLYISVLGDGFYQLNLVSGKINQYNARNLNRPEGTFTNNWINVMLCDKSGLLWLGHNKGVDCFDTKKGRFIKSKITEMLTKYISLSLLEDKKGAIWIGTDKGLYVFNKKNHSTKKYNVDNGLSNNVISGLAEDEEGDIWCSTFYGINQLKLRDQKIIKYYSGNGLLDNCYTTEAYLKDKEGVIYFGSSYGITSFLPANVTQVNYNKKVVISNFYIHGLSVNGMSLSNGNKIIETSTTNASKFDLSSKDNTFTVEFTTMDFVNQENIYYEYRLNNLSKVWHSTLPGENRITYNDLSPGNYVLEVRASKNGSYSPIRTYEINILAPWYRTTLAYLIYLLILCAISVFVIKILRRVRNEKLNEAKFQSFINISHEIRSPMTMIISPLEKLLKEDFDKSTKHTLQTIHRNANRILGLINQLLDVRKFDKGQMQIKCSETDMVEFIKEIFQVFEYQSEYRKINLTLVSDLEYFPVWIDRNNFDKIVINLLSNSFKYTPDSGEISVILSSGIDKNIIGPLHRYAEISILDTGIGLDSDNLNKIFDRFYQIDNDMTFASIGTGVGLNLCKILTSLHHGTISATNRLDTQGSCFTIRIPLGKEHLQKNEIIESESNQRPILQTYVYNETPQDKKKLSRSKTNFKILVVDDDDEIREYLRYELEDTYKIILSSNGEEALKEVYSNTPDLIISDVVMPKMDGLDFLKKIRTNSNFSHIPVILLTSKIEQEDRISGLEIGADAYLAKPFNIDELLVQINNLIANRRLLKGKYSGAQDQLDKIKKIDFKSSDEILMERIMNFVNEHIGNSDLNVEMLAQSVGLSRVQLHRKLKEITGLPTAEFIRNLKLKQSTILLIEKKMNITQIAYAVGFTNQTHFSTAFKKFYGITPTEYIEKQDHL